MLDKNVIDKMVEFCVERLGEGLVFNEYGGENGLKQYLSFHFMYGNLLWTEDKDDKITGILISYKCDPENLEKGFNWEPETGDKCIFVAELVAKDTRARNLLAKGFLQRYPTKKETYAKRRGRLVTIKAHDISQNFINN
jgi:hypothetical protein